MWQEFSPYVVACARSIGFFAVVPNLPDMAIHNKLILGLVIGMCLGGLLPDSYTITFAGISVEVLIGILLAVPVIFMVEGAALAGELIDTGRGQLIAQAYDPFSSSQSSLLLLVCRWGTLLLLISSGLFERLLFFLGKSYVAIPYLSDFSKLHNFASLRLQHGLELLCSATSLALLFLGVFALCDVLWIFASRVLQGIPTNSEIFLMKLIVGFSLAAYLLERIDVGPLLMQMVFRSS